MCRRPPRTHKTCTDKETGGELPPARPPLPLSTHPTRIVRAVAASSRSPLSLLEHCCCCARSAHAGTGAGASTDFRWSPTTSCVTLALRTPSALHIRSRVPLGLSPRVPRAARAKEQPTTGGSAGRGAHDRATPTPPGGLTPPALP